MNAPPDVSDRPVISVLTSATDRSASLALKPRTSLPSAPDAMSALYSPDWMTRSVSALRSGSCALASAEAAGAGAVSAIMPNTPSRTRSSSLSSAASAAYSLWTCSASLNSWLSVRFASLPAFANSSRLASNACHFDWTAEVFAAICSLTSASLPLRSGFMVLLL